MNACSEMWAHARIKTDTHLQQKGPRSRLCPRRRCSSGAGKLPPIQTQGTLQNRHVKSQARESHWKKIQICCAKNTNKDSQHAFFKLTRMSFVSPVTTKLITCYGAVKYNPLSDVYVLWTDHHIVLLIALAQISSAIKHHGKSLTLWSFISFSQVACEWNWFI